MSVRNTLAPSFQSRMTDLQRPSVVESPWFWACLFSFVACGVLATIGPKYGPRQAQIEREYHARRVSASGNSESLPNGKYDASQTIITLSPLLIMFAVIMIFSGAVLVWQRFVRPYRRVGDDDNLPSDG